MTWSPPISFLIEWTTLIIPPETETTEHVKVAPPHWKIKHFSWESWFSCEISYAKVAAATSLITWVTLNPVAGGNIFQKVRNYSNAQTFAIKTVGLFEKKLLWT